MHFLVFSPYYPPHMGGLESHAAEFNRHLIKQGHKIITFTPHLPTSTPEKENYDNLIIIRYPAWEIISNFPLPRFWSRRFWSLFLNLYNQKIDITISRTRFFPSSFLALIYAKTKKTKFVHIEHGSDFVQLSSRFKNQIARIYDHTLGKLIFKTSHQNIAISQAVKKFINRFDQRPTPVIYRGLNMKEIDIVPPNTTVEEKYASQLIITFAGRLYKWKGVSQSIAAVQSLSSTWKKKIVFLIIGEGEDFPHLQKMISSENSIKLLGSLTREETLAILKVSDIYIHSAFPGGGLSTSLMEAMYCQNAIIATPYEGAQEIIKNNKNGYLIDNNQPALIAEKIIDLANNPDKIKIFGGNAHKFIQKNFSWKESIEKYEQEFKRVLEK